jgi:hypothetical protein
VEVPPLAAGVGRGDHDERPGRVRAPFVHGLPGLGADQEPGLGMFSHDDGLLGDNDNSSWSGQDRSPDYTLMLAALSALDSRLAVPFPARADLDQLRAAFPDFSFGISRGWRGPVFEAWRDPAADGLYAVITEDSCELWRELTTCQQAAIDDIGSTP